MTVQIMINYIFAAVAGFLAGFIFFSFLNKGKNNSELITMLNDFKKSIEEYKIKNEINSKELQNSVKDASKLAKLLTTNQNLKGQYGEDCLEIILKTCYPNNNINYIKQLRTQNIDNQEIKPDFLINLPNNKNILIDCKVNIEKFLEYKENEDKTCAQAKKQEFIKDLNTTINLLSNKKYETALNINQPDFILMYIPLEPVLTLIYTDKDFLGVVKNANEKNIIIVGNSSILTTIRLTKLLWAQDAQEKNIENIIALSQNIYKFLAQHSQNLYEIKQILEENSAKFNKEYEKITKNNPLFKNTEQLREYGVQIENKKIGKKLVEVKIHDDFLK